MMLTTTTTMVCSLFSIRLFLVFFRVIRNDFRNPNLFCFFVFECFYLFKRKCVKNLSHCNAAAGVMFAMYHIALELRF